VHPLDPLTAAETVAAVLRRRQAQSDGADTDGSAAALEQG